MTKTTEMEKRERELWRQIYRCHTSMRNCIYRDGRCYNCMAYPCKLVKERNKIIAKILESRGQREVQET